MHTDQLLEPCSFCSQDRELVTWFVSPLTLGPPLWAKSVLNISQPETPCLLLAKPGVFGFHAESWPGNPLIGSDVAKTDRSTDRSQVVWMERWGWMVGCVWEADNWSSYPIHRTKLQC